MCPECEHTVDPDELDDNPEPEGGDEEFENEFNDDDSEVTDGGEEVIHPSNDFIFTKPQRQMSKSCECPQCHQINFRDLNEACICSNCNYEIE